MLARSAVETLGDRRKFSPVALLSSGGGAGDIPLRTTVPLPFLIVRKMKFASSLVGTWVNVNERSPSPSVVPPTVSMSTNCPAEDSLLMVMVYAASGTSGSVAVSAANAIPAGRKESKATARMNGIFFNFSLSPYMDFRRLLLISFHRSTGRRGRGTAAAAASSAATARQDHPRHDRQHPQNREKHFLHRILPQWMAGSGLPLVRPYRHFSPETSFLIPGRKGSRRSRHD